MGRLVAVALVVVAAGIGVVIANGPGTDKPEEREALIPKNQSTKVELSQAGGTQEPADSPGTGTATVTDTVKMQGLEFSPSVVNVKTGDAVRFVNRDDVVHTVYEDVGARSGLIPLFASDRIPRGDAFSVVLHTAGTIRFVCTLHPTTMQGRIIVTGDNA